MANVFKNAVKVSVGTSGEDVYTAGSGVTATVIGATVANRHSSSITIDATITDSSASATPFIVKAAPIGTGSSLVLIGGDQKVVLETGDKITITSNTASSADVIISVLEST